LLYELDTAGNFTALYTFTGGGDGSSPNGLVRDSAGNIYGTAAAGGTAGYGVVFKLDTAGNFTVLYTFAGASGESPQAAVILDPAGNLYGTTASGGSFTWGTVFKVDPAGQETVLYSFSADGGTYPSGGLIGDSAGNLYGTTAAGGAFGLNCGVVYKLDGAGHFTVLYSFTCGADGWQPSAGLVRDSAGNLYGTTWNGGSAGHGVVFKLDTAGTETVLYNFTGGADGGNPVAGVVLDPAGNIYGNSGVIFKLDTAGDFTVLHKFTGGTGGSFPYAGVIRDPAGNLYGTTAWGGNLNCQVYLEQGCGLVYKLDPAGNYTVLYTFSGGSDGAIPYFAGVARDPAGNLYGTTAYGGTKDCGGPGCGTVFKLDPSGKETVLHRFTGGDGARPEGLSLDSDGGIYGTTPGVVFNIDPAGQFTVLYSFTGSAVLPGLVHDPAGALFGTLSGAGSDNPWVGGGCLS
jgi:uncharacterized repeat protein (TIGR03803 family)